MRTGHDLATHMAISQGELKPIFNGLVEKLGALVIDMRSGQDLLMRLSSAQADMKPLIVQLAENERSLNPIVSAMANVQVELKPILARLADASGDSAGMAADDATRQHIRNMDIYMARLLEEVSAGRSQSVAEIRSEIKLLARAMASLAKDA